MELISALASLTQRAEAVKRDVSHDQRALGIQTRARQLDPISGTFERLAAQSIALRKGRVPVQIPDKASAVAKAAARAVSAFEVEPSSVIEIPDDIRYGFWDQIGDLAARTTTAHLDAWRVHVQSSLPPVDRQLFDALPTVTSAHRTELLAIIEATRALEGNVPAGDDGLEQLSHLIHRVRRLLADVDIDGLPADVQILIRAIAQRTATLDLITPTVAAWLETQGLTGRVYLRFGEEGR